MLVLNRRVGENIRIGNDIEVVVVGVTHGRGDQRRDQRDGQVRLGIRAPGEVTILRGELIDQRPQSDEGRGEARSRRRNQERE